MDINTILAPLQSLFECFALTSCTRLRLMYCLVLSSVGEKQTTLHPPSCTSMAASWSCHWLQDRHTTPLLSSRPPPSKPFSITDAPTVEICTSVYFIIMTIILKVEIPKPLLHHRRLLGCVWWRHAGDLHVKSFLHRIEQRVTDGMSDCWVHNLSHQQQLRAVDGGRAAREGKITTIFYPTRSPAPPAPQPHPQVKPTADAGHSQVVGARALGVSADRAVRRVLCDLHYRSHQSEGQQDCAFLHPQEAGGLELGWEAAPPDCSPPGSLLKLWPWSGMSKFYWMLIGSVTVCFQRLLSFLTVLGT